ncbi:hypothetical protein Lesp02_47060 [Lentzea sp. NBRC 105346]|uniref:hypothetical protein n=1 Tax=Lentzea sp. NBRC 105346 TaxID=3032205 RepID=UPI0024A2B83F|nr:hypothetical protein [Lentzea sp. NBRC 105346]GLZ32518.1 hypothetical protein Lesp02_47060 [Lentzea sp. NBRC 105346]
MKNVNRAVGAALFTGSLLMLGSPMAHADDLITVNDEIRVGDLLSVPVKVCGNAVNILGNSDATCPKAPAEQRATAAQPLISAPVTVCGNSVGVLGGGSGSCGDAPQSNPGGSVVTAPVTVCGNAVGVAGDTSGDCGKTEEPPGEEPPGQEPPGQNPPGQNPPNNGGPGQTPPGSPADEIGDHLGLGRPSTIGSPAAQASEPVKPLPNTGADVLQLMLAAVAMVASGVMARRAGRRQQV